MTRGILGRLAAQCEKLAETVAPTKQWARELTGYVMEVWQEVAVERGRINSLPGFVLPRLGSTSAAVEGLQKQMTEHREYCGAVLRELRVAAAAGFRHSVVVGVGGV